MKDGTDLTVYLKDQWSGLKLCDETVNSKKGVETNLSELQESGKNIEKSQ